MRLQAHQCPETQHISAQIFSTSVQIIISVKTEHIYIYMDCIHIYICMLSIIHIYMYVCYAFLAQVAQGKAL